LLLLLLLATSCSQSAAHDGDPAIEADSNLIVIGFSQVGAESDWRIANTQSMRETLTEDAGYQLIFKDAQQKQENQIAAIREFISQKVDYIVLAPVTENGWDEVLAEARDAAIPVIIVDRMINVADDGLYTCWVGSDFRSEGGMAIAWIEEHYGEQAVSIAHIQGTQGSSAQLGRTESLEEGVTNHANWHIVSQDSGDFTQSEGKAVMERMIREAIDIDVVYCENDNMAFGAIEALEEAHLAYGTSGGIQVISFDATHSGLELTLAGQISLNVECNPLHGPRVLEIIEQLEAGNSPVKRSFVIEESFDAETITQAVINARAY
jgi:simple sugar transport system substrate-binding protein